MLTEEHECKLSIILKNQLEAQATVLGSRRVESGSRESQIIGGVMEP